MTIDTSYNDVVMVIIFASIFYPPIVPPNKTFNSHLGGNPQESRTMLLSARLFFGLRDSRNNNVAEKVIIATIPPTIAARNIVVIYVPPKNQFHG